MENSAASKLKLGLERLAKAGTDADMLGLALQSIHGALEDGFRAQIAANPQVPESLRTDVLDPKKSAMERPARRDDALSRSVSGRPRYHLAH